MNKQNIFRILLSIVGMVFFWYTFPYLYRVYIVIIPAIAIYFLLSKLNFFPERKEPYRNADEKLNWGINLMNIFSLKIFTFLSEIVTIVRKAAIALLVIVSVTIISVLYVTDFLKEKRTQTTLNDISSEIETFKNRNNRLPENLEEVIAQKPLHASWKKDFWENPILYTKQAVNYTLVSKGKDGILNTEDDLKNQK